MIKRSAAGRHGERETCGRRREADGSRGGKSQPTYNSPHCRGRCCQERQGLGHRRGAENEPCPACGIRDAAFCRRPTKLCPVVIGALPGVLGLRAMRGGGGTIVRVWWQHSSARDAGDGSSSREILTQEGEGRGRREEKRRRSRLAPRVVGETHKDSLGEMRKRSRHSLDRGEVYDFPTLTLQRVVDAPDPFAPRWWWWPTQARDWWGDNYSQPSARPAVKLNSDRLCTSTLESES